MMKAFLISSEYTGTVQAVVLAETEQKAINEYAKQFEGDFDKDDITAVEKPLMMAGASWTAVTK